MRTTLKGLVHRYHVRADAFMDYSLLSDDFRESDPWRVTLYIRDEDGRRQMTVPFYTGYGLRGRDPTADGVLECLLSDASSYDNNRDFEDWARDLGFDPDSRKAERTYKAVERQTQRLQRFLGDEYESFLYAEIT